MSFGEICGYVASVLVFITFYMRTMVPLRLVAIASNVIFITYAATDDLIPILILHCALLPLNVLRLVQLRDLMKQVEQAATEGFSVKAIIPLMQRRTIASGETLFAADQVADELYYVMHGTLFLPELNQEIGRGAFVGEFALFSSSGRRTTTVVARTDCQLMVLTRTALFSALLQHPRLGIHLLKLITARLLRNAGRDSGEPPVPIDAVPEEHAAELPPVWYRRRSVQLRAAAIGFFLVALAITVTFHPLYNVAHRDAVLTTWSNAVAAPISGVLEKLEARPGYRATAPTTVARIANPGMDRSSAIRAEAAVEQAEARLGELTGYTTKLSGLTTEWQERRNKYADGFRSDLDLQIEELERRIAQLKERAAIAAATPDLERVRHRRDLAGRGVYLQDDGKEPEWSWRSIDEIRLETAKAERDVRAAQQELKIATANLARERSNLQAGASAAIEIPAGATVWSIAVPDGAFVERGQKLLTWIDCGRIMVDVPVTETTATLVQEGARAEVTVDGENAPREGIVAMSRGASSRINQGELISLRTWRQSAAQILVQLKDSERFSNCPVGRLAFVRFPDLTFWQFLRANLPKL